MQISRLIESAIRVAKIRLRCYADECGGKKKHKGQETVRYQYRYQSEFFKPEFNAHSSVTLRSKGSIQRMKRCGLDILHWKWVNHFLFGVGVSGL